MTPQDIIVPNRPSRSALASPRSSSSSSSDPSIPPLTPMFDLDLSDVVNPTMKGLRVVDEDDLHLKEIDIGEEDKTPPAGHIDDSPLEVVSLPLVRGGEEPEIPSGNYSFPPTSSSQPLIPIEVDPTDTVSTKSLGLPVTPTKLLSTSTTTAIPIPVSTSPNLPQSDFSFGTCSSQPLQATPTAEMGTFEYPELKPLVNTPPESSLPPISERRRSSIASGHLAYLSFAGHAGQLGHSGNINAIHARGMAVSTGRRPSYPSPPTSRRSSTCSTITTLPITGRRPSVLHSISIPGPAVDLPIDTVDPLGGTSTSSSTSSVPTIRDINPTSPTMFSAHYSMSSQVSGNPPTNLQSMGAGSRRPSLLFQQRALPAPIPPSLLTSRRGSLPASQLFGLPLNLADQPYPFPPVPNSSGPSRTRASFSSALSQGFSTTTPQLYHRRESIVSESGVSSSGSSKTVQGRGNGTGGEEWNGTVQIDRRSSLRSEIGNISGRRRSGTEGREKDISGSPSFPSTQSLGAGGRRSSLPQILNLPPRGSILGGSSKPLSPHKSHAPIFQRRASGNINSEQITPTPSTPTYTPRSTRTSISQIPITSSPTLPTNLALAHHRRSRQHSSTSSTRGSILSTHSSSSTGSGQSVYKSLSSSSEGSIKGDDEDEDELEALPISGSIGSARGSLVGRVTMGTAIGSVALGSGGGGGGPMFNDPWAEVEGSDEVAKHSSGGDVLARPTLETIDSEGTERGEQEV